MANVPIFDPNRGFRLWLISEIYTGNGSEDAVYIPNVNDAIWDWETGLYRVVSVDIENGISTWTPYRSPIINDDVNKDDILSGVSPSRPSECYRLYINTKIEPYSAAIDSRLHVYGSENSYVRLFQGSDISDMGTVVSLYYNDNKELKDDRFPLELSCVIGADNRSIKVPTTGYVNKGLDDGELITCVVYSNVGVITSINPLLVKNTQYVRASNFPTLYITGISLQSPFLSNSSPDMFEVPLHLPIDSLNITGHVRYSNGNTRTMPIDGVKFAVHGLETFVATLSGQTLPLVATYTLSEEETSYSSTDDSGKSISMPYRITTLPPEDGYSIKLFVIPTWSRVYSHWELIYYLFSLERGMYVEATDIVQTGIIDGNGYNPLKYGVTQRITVAIDMKDVDPNNVAFRHVQVYDITLLSPIDKTIPYWTLGYNLENGIIYGKDVVFYSTMLDDGIRMIIDCEKDTLEEWLSLLYYSVYPIFNSYTETVAPKPTHAILSYGEVSTTVMVEDYGLSVTFDAVPRNGETITVNWILRTEATDLYLAVSPVTLQYTD